MPLIAYHHAYAFRRHAIAAMLATDYAFAAATTPLRRYVIRFSPFAAAIVAAGRRGSSRPERHLCSLPCYAI